MNLNTVARQENLLDNKIENNTNSNNDSDIDTANKVESSDLQNVDNKQSPLTTQCVTRKKSKKTVIKKKLCKKQLKTYSGEEKISKIASSILEGEFIWNGERWCLNKSKTAQICKTSKTSVTVKKPSKEQETQGPKLCDLCGEVVEHECRLIAHKKRVHYSNPVKCPECSLTCSSQYYLNCHIERKHRNNKNYQCSTCGTRFAFIKDLQVHIKYVHEKKYRRKVLFTCELCGKIYKCMQSLTIHKRSAHTGERPDVCSVCGAGFYHVVYLKEHMRVHTGETPYKCPICDRGYTQRGNMRNHLRSHRKSELDADTLSQIRPIFLKFLAP